MISCSSYPISRSEERETEQSGMPALRWTGWAMWLCMVIGCAAVAPRPPAPGMAARVVELARGLCGTPYCYGGNTPQGFDCSGLVQHVFLRTANLKLPRTSKKQFIYSRPIRRGNEQPSDLLFFSVNRRGPSHVGIYSGRGLFIHASHTGGNVKISDANSKYWRRRFIGVRRVLR